MAHPRLAALTLLVLGVAAATALAFFAPTARHAGAASAAEPRAREPVGRTIVVPLDHARPNGGRDTLYYELGAPFDRAKPTVLVVADGQQFYVRRGAMAELQQEEFGPDFNVVGLVGRGFTPAFIRAAQRPDETPDWEKAWRLFRHEQWVDDLDAVRRALVGPRGKVLVVGVSGGAHLAHQYLARHGEHVTRALTAAAVDPYAVREFGLESDRFWEEIGGSDSTLHALTRRALERFSGDRQRLVMTIQRQNFFVATDTLGQARASLIRALAAGDTARYAAARRDYQVEPVSAFLESPAGIPIRVRLYELFGPTGFAERSDDGIFRPDLENQSNFARPLLDLERAGRIDAPSMDRAASHRLATEVFILSGRWDHTVDYRTQIALAARYPHSLLFLSNDDHQLHRLTASGDRDRLGRAFLRYGLESDSLRAALRRAEPNRWRE